MYRSLAVATLVILVPLFSYALTMQELEAQLDALLKQIAAIGVQTQVPATTGGQCPNLGRTLSRGMTGSDVTQCRIFSAVEDI
jgi:hypothetical protein